MKKLLTNLITVEALIIKLLQKARTSDEVNAIVSFFNGTKMKLEAIAKATADGRKVWYNYIVVLPSGKIYIGCTSNGNVRWELAKYTSYMKQSLIADGVQNVKQDCVVIVTDIFETREQALRNEEKLILQFHACDRVSGCNIHSSSYAHVTSGKVSARILYDATIKPNHRSFVARVKLPGKKEETKFFSSTKAAVVYTGLTTTEVKAVVAKARVIK